MLESGVAAEFRFQNVVLEHRRQVVSGETKSGDGGCILISGYNFWTPGARRREDGGKRGKEAAEYRFLHKVSGHSGQGGEEGKAAPADE
jgi:hypothetical protein